MESFDALGLVGHGDGAAMAERDHIGIDTFGGVSEPLDLGRRRPDGSFGEDTQRADTHISCSFGHGFSFIRGK